MPFDMFKEVKRLQKQHEHIKKIYGYAYSTLEYKRTLDNLLGINYPDAYIKNYLRQDIEEIRRILGYSDLVETIQREKDQYSQLSSLGNVLRNTNMLSNSSIKRLIVQQQDIIGMVEQLKLKTDIFQQMHFPHQRLASALAGTHAIFESFKLPKDILKTAVQLPMAYQNFIYHQLKKSNKDIDEIKHRRLTIIDLSGDLLEASQSAIEIAMVELRKTTKYVPEQNKIISLNLFSSLNQHLACLYDKKRTFNVYLEFEKSIPANINNLGCAICELIFHINQFSQRKSGEDIFKPTNKSFYASYIVPNRIANSEHDFGEVTDYLYFLLYEGSGNASRLTKILTDDELSVLWTLKHIRLGLRHDVEHGKEKEIKKKFQDTGRAYQKLIGKPSPLKASDWKKAQVVLYELIVEMLKLLRAKQEQKY